MYDHLPRDVIIVSLSQQHKVQSTFQQTLLSARNEFKLTADVLHEQSLTSSQDQNISFDNPLHKHSTYNDAETFRNEFLNRQKLLSEAK